MLEVAWIKLTKGRRALVDAADLPLLATYKWHARVEHDGRAYAMSARGTRSDHISMHRWIMGAVAGQIVDHINGDGLDNRRANLRLCTNAENIRNSKLYGRKRTSKLRGVYRLPDGRFRAQISVNMRKINLGNYLDEIEAAEVYDNAARQHFGEFARPNFPQRPAA